MPASPDDGARLAARILEIIGEAERALLALLAGRLRVGITAPGWEAKKLAELQMLRARILARTTALNRALLDEINRIIPDAYNHGQALAVIDLEDSDAIWTPSPWAAEAAEQAAQPAADAIDAAVAQIPQRLTDVYQRAVQAGVQQILGGDLTRVQATQQVMDELAERGIAGFRDKAGRNWALDTYCEMAVRTAAGNAAIDGHADALAASGHDLVIVSDHLRECPLCAPFERQILSLSGVVGAVIVPNVLTDQPMTVRVKDSLAGARAKGFMHPNCRHTISAYTPGATRKGVAEHDPAGYDNVQRQRTLERKVREWKRRQALALDDYAARQAARKVREWQTRLRDHLDETDLPRSRKREQAFGAR